VQGRSHSNLCVENSQSPYVDESKAKDGAQDRSFTSHAKRRSVNGSAMPFAIPIYQIRTQESSILHKSVDLGLISYKRPRTQTMKKDRGLISFTNCMSKYDHTLKETHCIYNTPADQTFSKQAIEEIINM